MDILKVTKNDGTVVILPNPQTMEFQVYDVDADGTGRNQRGLLFRDRVAVKRKLVCTWPPMKWDKLSALMQACTDQFFTLQYPDGMTGTVQSMTCYVGDRSVPVAWIDTVNNEILYENLSMNFIER